MRAPDTKPTLQLSNTNGNAHSIMGRVKRKLAAAGADQEYINQYLQESMGGDYDNLLQTATKYVEIV